MSTDPNPSNFSSRVRVSEMEQDQDSASVWDWDNLLDFSVDDVDPLILPWEDSTLDPGPPPPPPPPPAPPAAVEAAASPAGRVRKRDPRLLCENFLAGRVPCACPEVDEMMLREEEDAEEAAGGRKRARARARAKETAAVAVVRCQVPGCAADIRELKGYHRRYRVCLRCANAPSVVIDGENRRYCQQCGKFHTLSDFDERKRSCRRKLERHNRKRRRRPIDLVSIEEKEKGPQADLSTEATYDEEPKEGSGVGCEAVLISKGNTREILLDSDDGHGSPICSLPISQNMQSKSIMSFTNPVKAHVDEEKDNSKSALSSTICDNRSAYSSSCPTGRISFKLYDWNPAEFPRRLRHQIFQWLASMPVELEGYVRPGCTILTIFIAMPQFMWEKVDPSLVAVSPGIQQQLKGPWHLLRTGCCNENSINPKREYLLDKIFFVRHGNYLCKHLSCVCFGSNSSLGKNDKPYKSDQLIQLSQDATLYIKDLINAPESLLLGRGNIYIFLSNIIIQVLKGGSSLTNIKMEVKAPRIHYVHPTYFEAGKPMEFVACGSNLNQPKFRFLVSFAGKYMVYDSCFAVSHGKISPYDGNKKSCQDSDHEMLRIRISRTDSKIFGPAFVEVENESGISNFIPILIGNKHICSELERMQVVLNGSSVESLTSPLAISGTNPSLCEHFVAKQMALSELLVDVAWLLKELCIQGSEAIFNSINLQRLTCLLKISIENELVNVLEVILNYLDVVTGTVGIQGSDYLIADADAMLLQGYVNRAKEILSQRALHDARSELDGSSRRDSVPQSYVTTAKIQDGEARSIDCLCSTCASAPQESDENVPLIATNRKHCYPDLRVDWDRKSWVHSFPSKIRGTRLAVFMMVSVVMCLGACIVLLHPLKPEEIAVSIRRCLFGYRLS